VGSGDRAICRTIAQAATAYDTKQIDTWQSDMAQIGKMAASAQNSAIKTDATKIKQAYDAQATHKKRLGGLLSGLGGYVGFVELKNTCANLHL